MVDPRMELLASLQSLSLPHVKHRVYGFGGGNFV